MRNNRNELLGKCSFAGVALALCCATAAFADDIEAEASVDVALTPAEEALQAADMAEDAAQEASVAAEEAEEYAQQAASAADQAVAAEASEVVPGFVPAPPTEMGQVVFFRKGGLVGAAISCAARENGEIVTHLPPGRYSVVAATPGIHEYSVQSEAKDTLRLEVEEGETYFAECKVKMGFMAGRPNISPSDEARFVELSPKLKPVKVEDDGD